MPYYVRARQMTMARAAAVSRQQALWQAAQASSDRLDTAERFYKSGDIVVAARLYAAVARSRPKTEMTEKARSCLDYLAEEARRKIGEIDTTLSELSQGMSPGERLTAERWPDNWKDGVATAFQEYDQIVDDYRAVPAVKNELKSHVSKQRRQREYAAVLKEPEAKTLWDLAQQHEQEDQSCCAYWAYERASKLLPAPSARRAADQLAEMQQDPELMAAAERCRELQWCHRTYRLADRLASSKPGRAKELFAQIVERSPQDTEIHRDAQLRIENIRQ